MRAGTFGQELDIAALELDAREAGADRVILGCAQVDPAGLVVDLDDAADLELALGELTLERAVGVVVIEMLPAIALAVEKERAIGQPAGQARAINPGFVLVAEETADLVTVDGDLQKVEPGLRAVLHIGNHGR